MPYFRHLPGVLLAAALMLSSGPAHADTPLRVVATIKPVHGLLAAVMQGVGAPDLLLKNAQASPHGFALRPSDARRLEQADLIVWVGPGLETFLVRALDAARTPTLSLIDVAGLHRMETDGADGDDGHGHGHDGDTTGIDPHIWLDPANARTMATAMAERLADIDPANAATYRANAIALAADITRLHTRLQAQLAPVSKVPFAVYHDGYGYFVEAFGLTDIGHMTQSPDRLAGAAHTRDLRTSLREQAARCLFIEPGIASRHTRALVEGLDIKLGTLDPLGASLPAGADHYERMMTALADALAACLGAEGG